MYLVPSLTPRSLPKAFYTFAFSKHVPRSFVFQEALLLLAFKFCSSHTLGFPCGSAGKESACNVGDLGSIPGLGRSLGERKGYALQYSGLENSMDYTVSRSRTRLSDFHFTYSTLERGDDLKEEKPWPLRD